MTISTLDVKLANVILSSRVSNLKSYKIRYFFLFDFYLMHIHSQLPVLRDFTKDELIINRPI